MSVLTISSASVLKREIDRLDHILSVPESEDSWETLSKGIQSLTVICKNGACDWPEELIPALRLLARPLINAMNSERTRLSGVAIDFIASVASGLGSAFEPLLQIFFPVLLTLSGRTNKVIIARARACITVVIETTQLPSILPYFLPSIKDKSTSLRLAAAEGTLACMNCFNPPDLEKDARARDIETVIRATARDANADVRKVSRKIFEAYKLLLPDRVDNFTGPLTPTMKKYLDIKTLNIRPQPTIASLTPNLDATGTLSASTSAIPSTRHSVQTFQSQALHSRAASSSAISIDKRTAAKVTKPVRLEREKSDMPPPPYVPVRPTQPNHVVSASRSTSTTDSRRRAVSTLSRSTAGQAGLPGTVKPGATAAYPARPASASSLRDPPHRLVSNPVPQPGSQVSVVTGPRRVPLPEVPKQAVLTSTKTITSTSKSQSTFKPARNNPTSAVKCDEVKLAVRRTDPGSNDVSTSSAVTGAVAAERAPKVRGVTQPTLAHLARIRPIAERKGPTVVASKAASKPLWGGRPTVIKATGKKVLPVQNSARQAPLVAATRFGLEGRSATPTQIPLPPSPSSSIAQAFPDSTSESDLPPLAPLLITKDLPLENGNHGRGVDEGQVGQGVSNDTSSDAEVIAPSTIQYSCGSVLDDTNSTVDEMAAQTRVPEPMTPRDLLTPGDFLDPEAALNKTPISALLSSIQRGFLFTPSSPLSPPQSYLSQGPASDGMKDLTIPFPLHIDGMDQSCAQTKKTFMFGVVGNDEASRHTLGSVENLNIL